MNSVAKLSSLSYYLDIATAFVDEQKTYGHSESTKIRKVCLMWAYAMSVNEMNAKCETLVKDSIDRLSVVVKEVRDNCATFDVDSGVIQCKDGRIISFIESISQWHEQKGQCYSRTDGAFVWMTPDGKWHGRSKSHDPNTFIHRHNAEKAMLDVDKRWPIDKTKDIC